MPTTSPNRNLPWIATSVVALALGLAVCANAFAQHAAAPQGRVLAAAEDMRLWSFGDCDRRFQYTGTPEYQECVRVVGSAEAVEARALHVCDVSHSADRQEAERCKANYKANKAKAAQDGVAADTPAGSQPAVSEEVMRRVKAIGSAAVEEQRAAAKVTPAPASAEGGFVPSAAVEHSSWKGMLLKVALLAFGVGAGVNLLRRKQAQAA